MMPEKDNIDSGGGEKANGNVVLSTTLMLLPIKEIQLKQHLMCLATSKKLNGYMYTTLGVNGERKVDSENVEMRRV